MTEWDRESKPEPGEGVPQLLLIHGSNNRARVADHYDLDAYPWSCLCELHCDFSFGPFAGTGWLIGPRTIITAGHCVFGYGEWAETVRIRRGSGLAGLEGTAKTVRSTEGWRDNPDPTDSFFYDYGAVFLAAEDAVDLDRYLSPTTSLDADLTGAEALLAGYPLSDGELMYDRGSVRLGRRMAHLPYRHQRRTERCAGPAAS